MAQLKEWRIEKVDSYNNLVAIGKVFNHKKIKDADCIQTSFIREIILETNNLILKTQSGSLYKLSLSDIEEFDQVETIKNLKACYMAA